MRRRMSELGFVCAWLCMGQITVQAQEFKLFDRLVQVHGFVSQGFIYTNNNNWLTMNTSQGSAAFTDFGINISTRINDKLQVGAQLYDRNLGQLGQYHPSLDWAVVDYRFKTWLGIRGGKVKTTLGLYNDTQDLDFLHTFALLPQSVYPTDIRDATIAHLGGDIYGNIPLSHQLGGLSYTAYVGHRSDSIYSGYPYLLSQYGNNFKSFGGRQYGADLRWNTPVRGLVVGASRLDQDTTGKGTALNPFSDYDFIYGRALSQTIGTSVMRLADAEVLPYDFVDFADTIQKYTKDLEKLLADKQEEIRERNQELEEGVFKATFDPRRPTVAPAKEGVPPHLNFAPMQNAAESLAHSAEHYRQALSHKQAGLSEIQMESLRALNQRLIESERKLTNDDGLPRRPWYKHLLYAPGVYSGYDVKTVPSVREGIELKRYAEAEQEIVRVAKALQEESALIESAAQLLGY